MKIKIIASIVLLTILLAGCSKDFLEKKPLTQFGEGDVFNDASLLDAYILGTYRGMGHPFGGDGSSFTEGLTDNGYNQHNGTLRDYTHANVNRDNGENIVGGLWTNSYSNIRRVNIYFEKTTRSTIDPPKLKIANGEMRFLRAFFYTKLLSNYGGVPIVTASFPLTSENFDLARNSVDELADFIAKQCDTAIADLPLFANVQRGRISKEAAMALKGRALLYAASPLFNSNNDLAKWTRASEANKAVMDITSVGLLSPANSYHNLFNGKNSEEIILARYFTPTNAHGGGEWGSNLWLYPNGFNGWGTITPTQDLVDAYELTNGKLPSDPASGYNPQDPYINRDPRLSQSIMYNGLVVYDPNAKINRPVEYYRDKNDPTNQALAGRESISGPVENFNASRTRYNFRKYSDEGKPAYGDGGANESLNPFIYFRKAEAYLNYAECQLALNNEAEARLAIDAVRARISMPAVTESGAALLAKYQNERRVEFALEELRFDDMRRWKIGPAALNKPASGVDIYKSGNTLEYQYNLIIDGARKWDDKMYLLPIPYFEIQSSHSKLAQNPGY